MGKTNDDELLRCLFVQADVHALGEIVRRHEANVRSALASGSPLRFLGSPPEVRPVATDTLRKFGAQERRTFAVELSPEALLVGTLARDALGWCLDLRLYEATHGARGGVSTPFEGWATRLMSVTPPYAAALKDTAPRWLRRAEALLRTHPEAPGSPTELAGAVGVHPGHLMREFRRYYGCTVGDFVRRLRIERACRLLQSAEERVSVGQIAHTVGFADQSAFGKAFRRTTGVTPSEFRRARKNASPDPTMFPVDETSHELHNQSP